MKKIALYLIVGLAVTALQVATVAAQGGDPNMPPPMGDPNMPPPMGDPNMPPPMGDPNMPPPMGDPNMPPPMDGEDDLLMDDADLEALFAPPEDDEGDVPPLDDGSVSPAP